MFSCALSGLPTPRNALSKQTMQLLNQVEAAADEMRQITKEDFEYLVVRFVCAL
jgi:hypothetical protein